MVRLHYQTDGPENGDPVVLLHGFPLNHEMWANQAIYLANRGLRVIRPDLRGHGQSPTPNEPSTMERCAADLTELLDQLGIKKFRLGGFSVGGYIALEFIRRHPARVQALFLADSRAEPDGDEAKKNRLALIEKVRATGAKALEEAMLAKLLSNQTRQQRPEIVGHVREMIHGTTPEGAINILQGMMERPDQRPNLPAIKVPTLIVVGAEDALTPPDAAQVLAKGIPNSQLRIVTGAAHLAPFEQPEPVNHFLDHWLKGFADKPKTLPGSPAAARR